MKQLDVLDALPQVLGLAGYRPHVSWSGWDIAGWLAAPNPELDGLSVYRDSGDAASALIAATAAPGTVENMTDEMSSVPAGSRDGEAMIDAEKMEAHLVDAFNESALGNLKGWALGTCRRSETIDALRDRLEWLAPFATSDTLVLWFARRLASATGSAMAISCRVDDDDADDRDDVSMVGDGADVLSMQVVETERVWRTLDDAARRRWRGRLVQRIAAVSTLVEDSPEDATLELASCTAVAAAVVIHAANDGRETRSIDAHGVLAPTCPACGAATHLTQSTAGWAAVTGIDLDLGVATIGESVPAERGDVMCRGCLGEFSEDEVVRASIAFEAVAGGQQR